MKLFEVVVYTKNPIAGQKIDQKSIYKAPRTVALILAFIAISKTLRSKIEKIRPLLIYNRECIIYEKWLYFPIFLPP